MRFLILIIITSNLFGQTPKLDTVFCDCNLARIVSINGNKKVGPTTPPQGAGEKNEISHSKNNSRFVFEKEHHSAWYKLIINTNGSMVFDIIPNQTDDDYDFVLFKADKGNFCDSLSNFRIKPIRSCISRDKDGMKSRTGLSSLAKADFIHDGKGEQYVSEIKVAKGEIYYLVLDNVYKNGDGHVIQFYFEEMVNFSGIVVDENNAPVQTDIALINQKGDTVFTKRTEPNGSYNFNAPLRKNINYTLNFFNDKNFSFSRDVTLKDSVELKSITTVLPKLKKGAKHPMGSINFVPGETMYLQRSVPTIMNLFKLMIKNEKLKIKLIGHCNGHSFMTDKGAISFTIGRARTIQEFLVKKGISKDRIQIDGKGDHEMLFSPPEQITEKQAEMNRRVEVMVLEY